VDGCGKTAAMHSLAMSFSVVPNVILAPPPVMSPPRLPALAYSAASRSAVTARRRLIATGNVALQNVVKLLFSVFVVI
jgi:hypothetical protein